MRVLSPRLQEHLTTWDGTIAEPRPAATVVVLRDGAEGTREVFLMRRQATMAFAAGMFVFPGGRVEGSDGDAATPWLGPGAAEFARALGCDETLARSLVVGAVRETFEETGVLLAGTDLDHVVSSGEISAFADARAQLESGKLTMSDFLRGAGLAVRADLVAPFAHWITPEFEPRRYDTRFFVAHLPSHQQVGTLATEAERGEWVELTRAHESGKSGQFEMMPPTLHTIGRLVANRGGDVLTESWARPVTTIAPRLVEIDGAYWLDTPMEEEL